jgi:hypothetical protein
MGLKWRCGWGFIWWFGNESGIWGSDAGRVRATVKGKVGFVINLIFLEFG